MSLINSELTVAAQKSIDGKMFKIVGVQHVPYDSIAEILATVTSTRRHIGQVFRYIDGGGISDCHFVGDITDASLVKIVTGGGGGGIASVVAGTNVTVNNTDPANPIVSASGGGGTDTNFANTDLTADGDRSHDFSGHDLGITGTGNFLLEGTDIIIASPTSKATNGSSIEVAGGQISSAVTDSTGQTSAVIGVNVDNVYINAKNTAAGTSHILTVKIGSVEITTDAGLFVKFIAHFPVYDNEAAAVTAGLTTDQVYKTTTGELRIKL